MMDSLALRISRLISQIGRAKWVKYVNRRVVTGTCADKIPAAGDRSYGFKESKTRVRRRERAVSMLTTSDIFPDDGKMQESSQQIL